MKVNECSNMWDKGSVLVLVDVWVWADVVLMYRSSHRQPCSTAYLITPILFLIYKETKKAHCSVQANMFLKGFPQTTSLYILYKHIRHYQEIMLFSSLKAVMLLGDIITKVTCSAAAAQSWKYKCGNMWPEWWQSWTLTSVMVDK